MSGEGEGLVFGSRDLAKSRKELRVTGSQYGQVRVTVMPGVLGTEDGQRMLALASDRYTHARQPRRAKPRPKRAA